MIPVYITYMNTVTAEVRIVDVTYVGSLLSTALVINREITDLVATNLPEGWDPIPTQDVLVFVHVTKGS